jgi:hypothetical protein
MYLEPWRRNRAPSQSVKACGGLALGAHIPAERGQVMSIRDTALLNWMPQRHVPAACPRVMLNIFYTVYYRDFRD